MKNNLGKILLIFLILFSYSISLDAEDKEYIWSASINKKTAFMHEAIYLEYVCEFEDRGELYVIEFFPKSTEKFEIITLSQIHKIHNHKRIQTYEYVVFAKSAGRLDFDFDINMKKTNKDSIENTVLGRDNAQFEEYSTTHLKQKKLSIDIKKSATELFGSLDLAVKKDELKIKAYEPYHMKVSISGVGNLEALKKLDFSQVDAEVFASEPEKQYTLTKEGYKGTWSQKFAFVGKENFTIPKMEINYLDSTNASVKTLTIEATKVNVSTSYTQDELLDAVEDNSFQFKVEYLYYVLTFIAGFLLAKVNLKPSDNNLKHKNSFESKVNNAKTLEELHMLLILQNGRKFKDLIRAIENGQMNSMNEVKKNIIN